MGGEYALYRDKARLIGLTCVSAGLAAGMAYYLFYGTPVELVGKWGYIFGSTENAIWFCIISFTYLALNSFWKCLSSKPDILIDQDGVYDRRSTRHPIPWSSIADFGFSEQELWGADFEYLVLVMQGQIKKDIKFRPIYLINALFYTRKYNWVILPLTGLEFDKQEMHNAMHYARQQAPLPVHSSQPRRIFN